VVKKASTKSSKTMVKMRIAEESMAGHSSGSVTRRTACPRVAPRSIAACSISGFSSATRARRITVT
jgi:hypothetical protein